MSKTDGLLLDTINSFTEERIVKLSFACVAIWITSPVIAMILNIFKIDGYNFCGVWLTLLYFSGGFGLLFGFLFFLKRFSSIHFYKKDLIRYLEPFLLLSCLFIWSIFCTFFANEKRIAVYGYESFHDNLLVYLFYGGMIFCGMVLNNSRKYLLKTADAYLIVSSFSAAVALMNNKITIALCKNTLTITSGYESIYFETDHYAFCLVISLVVSVFFTLFRKNNFIRLLSFLMFVVFSVTLALNASLSGIIAIGIFCCLISKWVLNNCRENAPIMIAIDCSFILVLCGAFIAGKSFSFHEGLVNSWKNALEIVFDNPVVGIGPQNILTKAYNIYLQIAEYTGILGLLLFVSSFIVSAKLVLDGKGDLEAFSLCIVSIVGCYLIVSFFSVTMFYTAPYFYFAVGVMFGHFLDFMPNSVNKNIG